MNLGPEAYSPALLQKIVYAGADGPSYETASEHLAKLAELAVSPEEVWKLTNRIGAEMQSLRDERVAEFQETGEVTGAAPNAPAMAVVAVDGGRAQVRAEGAGRGVHEPAWREPRYARLTRYAAPAHDPGQDPHPDVPAAFLDEAHVRRLTQEIKTPAPDRRRSARKDPPPDVRPPGPPEPPPPPRAERLVETSVASLASSAEFGVMVAAEAARRRFYQAPRHAFLADGEAANWELRDLHFPDWRPILDFIHLVAYLFLAAQAARRSAGGAWDFYVRLVQAAWAGAADEVVRLLEQAERDLGPPPDDADLPEPWASVRSALGYVRRHAAYMDYARCRREGFPVTSCAIESLIKRFNRRVKGTDQFWVPHGLEHVLQARAALLATDTAWDDFWRARAARLAARPRPYRRAA